MKTWKRLISGLFALTLLASLSCAALAAEPEKTAPKPAGQFSQWFPWLGTDPAAPEASEAVLAKMGTVINQTKTVGGETVTLNGVVWEGENLLLSLVMKGKDFPADLTPGSLPATTVYTEECSLELSEEKWKEYVKKDVEQSAGEDETEAQVKEQIQKKLDMGQKLYEVYNNRLGFRLVKREGDTLTFCASMPLKNHLEKPELTLHIENLAIYEDGRGLVSWDGDQRTGPGPGKTIFKGPFDFTFTPEKRSQPLGYQGSVQATIKKIPVRITSAGVSPTQISVGYALDVKGPVNVIHRGEDPVPGATNLDIDKDLDMRLEGVWTKDGKYVTCSGFVIQGVMTTADGTSATGHWNREFPYPIDPAAVTAMDIGGTRVELAKLEPATR